MYKLFLTLRYLRKRRIVYVAIAAVTLCVAMVLVVLSVMGGWLDTVKSRARGLLGDVVIDNRSVSGFPLYEEFLAEVRGRPEIAAATPIIYSYGVIRFPTTAHTDFARVVGIRLNEIVQVNDFKQGLFYEKFYPGTTTLGAQPRPVYGIDLNDTPVQSKTGTERLYPPVLPEPYRSALEKSRKEHMARAGQPLDDPDSTDGQLNQILRSEGMPIIPGVFVMDQPEWPEDSQDPPPAPEPPTPRMVDDPLPGLIIGRDIVGQRQEDGRYKRYYSKGAECYITGAPMSITGKIDTPFNQPFRYADDSRTGIHEIDSQHVYCDFDLLQKLLHWDEADRIDPENPDKVIGRVPARCAQIQMKLKPGVDAAPLCKELKRTFDQVAERHADRLDPYERQLIGDIAVRTWEETQAHIIGPVQKEKMLVTILFGIISLVAVVLILCILYMIVLQKTRDIGILKAIGASSGGTAAIWVMYGLCVGIVGGLLGATLGSVFVWNINEFQDYLIWQFGWRVWDLRVYSFDEIPHHVNTSDVIAVVTFAILASTIGSVAAAWRAGRMEPVESIRYE